MVVSMVPLLNLIVAQYGTSADHLQIEDYQQVGIRWA
jgi:hypothetical protein